MNQRVLHVDQDNLLKAVQEYCQSQTDDFDKIKYLATVTQSLFDLTMAMGTESLASWKEKDEECLVYYAKSIKVMMGNQLDQLTKVLPQIEEDFSKEKLEELSEQLQRLQADFDPELMSEIYQKSQELREAQAKLDECRKLEEEMKTVDLQSILAETEEIEEKTAEYRKKLAERDEAKSEMEELASAFEKVDLKAGLPSCLHKSTSASMN